MKKTAIFTLILLAISSVAALAQVAIVDIDKVQQETVIGKSIVSKLEKDGKAKQDVIKAKNDKLQDIKKKVQNSSSVMTDAKRLELKQEGEKLQLELQELVQKSTQEFRVLQQKLVEDFRNKIMPIIEQVAKAKGHKVVISKTFVLYSEAGIDITAEVIKKVNSAFPK